MNQKCLQGIHKMCNPSSPAFPVRTWSFPSAPVSFLMREIKKGHIVDLTSSAEASSVADSINSATEINHIGWSKHKNS